MSHLKLWQYYLAHLSVIAIAVSVAIGISTGIWMALSEIPGFGGEEQNVVYGVQQVLAGNALYSDPSDVPFSITQYSPLYYLICGTISRVLAIDAQDAPSVTMVCRLISVMAALSWSLVAFLLLRRKLNLSPTASFIVAAVGFVSSIPWFFLSRPDVLMSLFLILSVFSVVQNESKAQTATYLSTVAAMLFAVLAIASKQNGVQAVVLVFLYVILARDRQKILVALTTLTGIVMFTLLALSFSKYWNLSDIKCNIVDGVRNGFDPIDTLHRTYEPFFIEYSPLIAISLISSIVLISASLSLNSRFFGFATLFLFAFAILTGLKKGSGTNYFIDFILFGAITSAVYLYGSRDKENTNSDHKREHASVFVFGVVFLTLAMFLPFLAIKGFRSCCYFHSLPRTLTPVPEKQYGSQRNIVEFIRQHITRQDEFVMVARDSNAFKLLFFPNVLFPQRSLPELAAERGLVDYQKWIDLVDSGKVRFIITRAGTRPQTFLGASFESYREVDEIDGYTVFEMPAK